MLPEHIHTSSTQTYIYPVHIYTFFQPYTMRFSSEENGLKRIDRGRGKTGGVAVQGCNGQVHTAIKHTYIHSSNVHI